MTTTSPTLGSATPLTTGDTGRYLFVEHAVEPGRTTPYLRPTEQRTYLLVSGSVEVDVVAPSGHTTAMTVDRLSGWHAPAGSLFRVRADPAGAVVVEAGAGTRPLAEAMPSEPPTASVSPVADYTVNKPWGHEIWYSHNLREPGYAVKQIHMTAGHQSSLQSHRWKAETNYVVDGVATVRNGLPAPRSATEVIDVDRIPVRRHRPGTSWTSAPNILHRVVAESTYTSIEVSTPELDDVIRWQDDTGRGDGRIAAEHRGAAR
jgi:quercetin dioxygenase-like cupin family protein